MKKTNIKAVIWDLDGTLIDSGEFHYVAERDSLAEQGIDIDKKTYKRFLSTKLRDFVTTVINEQNSQADPETILNKIKERTIENYKYKIPLAENAREVLNKVKENYKQALATAREKQPAMFVIERFELEDLFDELIFAEDADESKPDPEVFLTTADRLGVKSEACMVVEDGLNGIKAANAANMVSIARIAEHNQDVDFSSADHTIDDLRQILDILKEY